MLVRRPASLAAGGLCAAALALVAVLPASSAVGVPAAVSRPGAAGLLLVRHAGTAPVTIDTTKLAGPSLRAWWLDAYGDETVDGGPVRRASAVTLFPPDTGRGGPHDWTLLVVDATRGLTPPA
jgi:Putative collagen-binding domain of a collagenase